jgi:hypothetical protein
MLGQMSRLLIAPGEDKPEYDEYANDRRKNDDGGRWHDSLLAQLLCPATLLDLAGPAFDLDQSGLRTSLILQYRRH